MSNRGQLIGVITQALQDLRQSKPDYSGGIVLGKALGTLSAALASKVINYDEYERLLALLDNAYEQRDGSRVKREARHAA